MSEQGWVIISGASRGIGQACALSLAATGASLFLLGRDSERLSAVAEQCLAKGAQQVEYYRVDLFDAEQIKQCFVKFNQLKARLYGLVNAAGIMQPQSLMTTRLSSIEQQLQVNSIAPLLMAQYASRLMLRNKQGSIVNISSAVAEQGAAGQAAYASSKAAVDGLTKSLARELGPLGIRVNAVRPGIIDTDLLADLTESQRQTTIAHCDLQRIGQADEVAEVVNFLLSAKASYVHGQIIAVDGGLSL